MKKQLLLKKNDIVENKTVPSVNLKPEVCNFDQPKKSKGAKLVSEKNGKKLENLKTRDQRKHRKVVLKDAEAEEIKVNSTKTKHNLNTDSHRLSELPLINNVLKRSTPLPLTTPSVRGYDFNNGVDYSAILASFKHSGFQATNFGLAVEEILRMLVARRIPLVNDQEDTLETDDFIKRRHTCTIFLSYTADDAISNGVRQTIKVLAEHRMIDCIITNTQIIEQDLIECLDPICTGDLYTCNKTGMSCKSVPKNSTTTNATCIHFEDWLIPILDKMLEEQKKGFLWTPSKVITRLGEEINNTDSIYYWAAKNKIPVFSPALTAHGRLGNMMYFHSCKNPGLVIDIVSDLKRINTLAIKAITSGIIVIGGGTPKHHVLNANRMKGGADFGVFLNTIPEYDGSDSGARPDEAVSWGKVRKECKAVKIYAEASLVFPLLIAETFIRHFVSHKMRIVTSV